VPALLKNALGKDKHAKDAFNDLTLGRQREYADYISSAKREDTQLKRLDKVLPMIARGMGLNDKYRS